MEIAISVVDKTYHLCSYFKVDSVPRTDTLNIIKSYGCDPYWNKKQLKTAMFGVKAIIVWNSLEYLGTTYVFYLKSSADKLGLFRAPYCDI